MAPYHSTKLIISRSELVAIAETREREARVLLKENQYAGAMFLAGCALECYLKAAVCSTLGLEGLPGVFKTHDLEALLLYSGFRADLEAQAAVNASFFQVVETWGADGREALLYAEPSPFSKQKARRFMECLVGERAGVIPWLQSQISKRQGRE